MGNSATPKKKETEKVITVQFRVSLAEESKIRLLARLYAGGNVSKWLRYAALYANRVKLN